MSFFNKDINSPQAMGVLRAAASLLDASGPSLMPVSMGQALGRGLLGYQQGYQQGDSIKRQKEKEALEKKMAELKMKLESEPQRPNIGAINPGLYTPESLAAYEEGGRKDFDQLRFKSGEKAQEYNMFSQMTPEQKKEYLALRRGGFTLGGQRYDSSGEVIVDANTVADTTKQVEEAKAYGKAAGGVQGKDRAQAKIDLPRIEGNAQYMTGIIEKMIKHPGLPGAVGLKGAGNYIPGSPEEGFNALLKQVQGKAFLEAYQSLKGGGHITNFEGEKAEQALARLSTAQSEDEFIAAAIEFNEEVHRLTELVRQRAGAGQEGDIPSGVTSSGVKWSIE